MSLSTDLLGPYDHLMTNQKVVVSAAIPQDVKDRLFVKLYHKRGVCDKVISRTLDLVDAWSVKHLSLLIQLSPVQREQCINDMLNSLADHLTTYSPQTTLVHEPNN